MNCAIMAAQLMGSNLLSFYYQVVNTPITAVLSQAPRRWEVYPARAHTVEQIMVRHKAKIFLNGSMDP